MRGDFPDLTGRADGQLAYARLPVAPSKSRNIAARDGTSVTGRFA
jgi:hypothetical protein